MKKYIYAAIDLKSFYASVECQERHLDALNTHLVVADESKTEKTICLAVSPSLKKYGISGRARLFEVIQKVREENKKRKHKICGKRFIAKSFDSKELQNNPYLEIDFIIATPRMAYYIEYSKKIYEIYLQYFSPKDIHVYSIDEVFIDITSYLHIYKMTPKELIKKVILDIYDQTHMTATAGIGTNLYLAKVAMDIVAKHLKADQDGVRIAQLNEHRYRQYLWQHKPITDFWRIGHGYGKKLENIGLYTMGDIARCSLGSDKDYYNEDLLYKIFGINAELLIDHAWGYESCTMQDIQNYQPEHHSIIIGQVLDKPYPYGQTKLIIKEMVESIVLTLVSKQLVTDQIVLTMEYDKKNIDNGLYDGVMIQDRYGRMLPKQARGNYKLKNYTSSLKIIMEEYLKLFDKIIDKSLTVRKINMSVEHVVNESILKKKHQEQMNMFIDYDQLKKEEEKEKERLEKERRLQIATLEIKKKYGKNSVIKAMDLEDGAKARERNKMIGGHKA